MKIIFDDEMKSRVTKKFNEKTPHGKLLLDFDDGVGPLSKFGSCSINVHFRLLFVDDDVDTSIYDMEIENNLGIPLTMKGYSEIYFGADSAKMVFEKSYALHVLKTDNEVLDKNVEFIDFRKGDEQVA
jgi:uncharacterized protein YqkB